MEKFVKITFKDEVNAFKAYREIGDLAKNNDIDLNGLIVITKDEKGNATINNAKDEAIPFTLGGAITGSLLGIFAGPFGVLWGASLGMLAGMTGDLIRSSSVKANLDKAIERLDNNGTYILMLTNEIWETPLNVVSEKYDAKLERFDIDDIEDLIEKEYYKLKEEIASKKQQLEIAKSEDEKERLEDEIEKLNSKRKKLGKKIKIKTEEQKKQYKKWTEKLKAKYSKLKSKVKEEIQDEKEDFLEDVEEFKEEAKEKWEDFKDKIK